MPTLTEPTRAWIYRVLFAAAAVALVYRWGTAEQIEVWRALAEAVLTLGAPGLAARNTSTRTEAGQLVRTDNGPRPEDGVQP